MTTPVVENQFTSAQCTNMLVGMSQARWMWFEQVYAEQWNDPQLQDHGGVAGVTWFIITFTLIAIIILLVMESFQKQGLS